jgi:hypothetical protein
LTMVWVLCWALCIHAEWEAAHATTMLFLTPLWPMWFARKASRTMGPVCENVASYARESGWVERMGLH